MHCVKSVVCALDNSRPEFRRQIIKLQPPHVRSDDTSGTLVRPGVPGWGCQANGNTPRLTFIG
jgi:hypothetical protein